MFFCDREQVGVSAFHCFSVSRGVAPETVKRCNGVERAQRLLADHTGSRGGASDGGLGADWEFGRFCDL